MDVSSSSIEDHCSYHNHGIVDAAVEIERIVKRPSHHCD